MAGAAELYSVSEVADLLGCSPTTVLRNIAAGKIPATPVGKRFKVGREWVEKKVREANEGRVATAVVSRAAVRARNKALIVDARRRAGLEV